MRPSLTLVAAAVALTCNCAAASPAILSTATLGADTEGLAFDPVFRKAYVTNHRSGTLSIVNVDTGEAIAVAVGRNPRRLVENAATHRVYLVNDTVPGSVTVVHADNGVTLASIPVGERPRSIVADFQRGEVYVANRDSNTVSVIDTTSNTVVATIPVGRAPGGMDLNRVLGKLYVSNGADDTVSVINLRDRSISREVPVGRNPGIATVDERTGHAFVNNIADRTVSVIDGPSDRIVAELPTGAGSTFGTVSAVYHRYYLPNATDGTVTVVDTDSIEVVGTVSVGSSPQQVVVDPSDGDLYVLDRGSNSVTVVNAASETPTGTLAVGGDPWRLATSMDKLFVLNQNGDALDTLTIASEQKTRADTAIVTEYRHRTSEDYFHTSDALEVRVIGDGMYGGEWDRTMQFWRVWTRAAAGREPVCRFFGGGITHLYVLGVADCAAAAARDPSLQSEGVAYYVARPDASGACPAGTEPLYGLEQLRGEGAVNQRFTIDVVTRNRLQAAGWNAVGVGPQEVYACVPALVAEGAPIASEEEAAAVGMAAAPVPVPLPGFEMLEAIRAAAAANAGRVRIPMPFGDPLAKRPR